MKLTRPNLTALKQWPWRYTCAEPYKSSQPLCAKCAEPLPKSER